MTFESLLFLLLFSAICGFLAQMIVGYAGGGVLATMLVGFLGAVLGTWISSILGLPGLITVSIGFFAFPILWSILGAALLMGVVSTFIPRSLVY
jgi:uncharacterized membrane protein YeaQ/YmgE (transglycosylase-associated protein family)